MFDLDLNVLDQVQSCMEFETFDDYTIPLVAWRVGGVVYNGKPWDDGCRVMRLVIPSLRSSLDFNKATINDADDTVSEDITVQQFLAMVLTGDLDVVEMLSTPYIAVNPEYSDEFDCLVALLDAIVSLNKGVFLHKLCEDAKNAFEHNSYDTVLRLKGVMRACLVGKPLKEWFVIQQEDYEDLVYLYDQKHSGLIEGENFTDADRKLAQESLDWINAEISDGVIKTNICHTPEYGELSELFYILLVAVTNTESYDFMES